MMNRTARPLDFQNYDDYIAYALQTKQLRRAYLGDGNGRIAVLANGYATDHYGKVWIRFADGLDDNGATVFGQAIQASVNPNVNYTYKTNLPLLVRKSGANNSWIVEQVDQEAARNAGYNTHVLNPMSPENKQFWLRQAWDGRISAVATDTTPSSNVTINPFLFLFDGVMYDGGEAQSVDLSAYIPSTGDERLALIGKRANDNTVQVIQSATRTATTTLYDLSTIAALIDEFDDYVMPIQAVKLVGGATSVYERDLHQDLRQFMNVQQPRGFPNPVTRHRLIAAGYQEQVHGKLYITTGKVHIDGKLVLVTDGADSSSTDNDAIHDNVAAEISAITQKSTPVVTDVLLIEDSADSFNKKYIEIGDLPASGVDTTGAIAGDDVIADGSGSTAIRKNNFIATAAPTANDDSGDGYSVGSRWFDVTNDKMYECIDATLTAAIWIEVVGRTQTQTLTGKTISMSANTVGHGTAASKTIASDSVNAGTDRNLVISAQTGTSDALYEITGLSVGESVLIRAASGHTIQLSPEQAVTVPIYLNDGILRILDETIPMRLTLIATNVLVEDEQAPQRPYFNIAGSQFQVEGSGGFNLVVDDSNGKAGVGDNSGAISGDYLWKVEGTTGAFGLPSMTTSQRESLTPLENMAVYDTDYGLPFVYTAAASWMPILTGADGIPFVSPLNLTWTALNQTSGTYDDTTDRRLKAQCAGNGTAQLRGWYASLTPPFDYRFYIKFFNSDVNFNGVSIGFRQDSTGELHTFSQFVEATTFTTQYEVRKWNSATSVNSDYIAAKDVSCHVNWVRLLDNNASSRAIYISEDGTNWQSIHSIGRTDFLTADEVFFGLRFGTVASTDDAQAVLLSMENVG